MSASLTIGKVLKSKSRKGIKKSPIVIYESTVFPGATEEICIPIVEKESGLLFNESESGKGFFCGYSPERINLFSLKQQDYSRSLFLISSSLFSFLIILFCSLFNSFKGNLEIFKLLS